MFLGLFLFAFWFGGFLDHIYVWVFSATIKPKNCVEIFIVPMNPEAGSSQNVHGTYGKTHELRTHRFECKRLLCCAKHI